MCTNTVLAESDGCSTVTHPSASERVASPPLPSKSGSVYGVASNNYK